MRERGRKICQGPEDSIVSEKETELPRGCYRLFLSTSPPGNHPGTNALPQTAMKIILTTHASYLNGDVNEDVMCFW
jgi:hypothetical protein